MSERIPFDQSSRSRRFHDDSIMYFGKHKGEKLGEIPDSYFRWLLNQEWFSEHGLLKEYAETIEDR